MSDGLEEVTIYTDPCPVCLQDIMDPCKTQCGHILCKNCIEEWFKHKKATCPLCRSIIENYQENGERVKVIKIDNDPFISDEETERYMLYLRSIIGKLRFFKYMCYFSITTSLYLYVKNSNTYNTMQEYKNSFEICNRTLSRDYISDEVEILSNVVIVMGNHMRNCMIPEKYVAKCF